MNSHKILQAIKSRIWGVFPKMSYSRGGEDLILEEIFGTGKSKGFYVDVGAFHPIKYSNTFKFYLKGWRGINIDANKEVIDLFKKIRPRDINFSGGVGSETGVFEYFIFEEDQSMNTFSTSFKGQVEQEGTGLSEVKSIKVRTLVSILDEFLPESMKIDFISIDVEGLDLEVLKSNDWKKYRPKAIVVETQGKITDIQSNPIVSFLEGVGYSPVAFSLVTLNAGNFYFLDSQQI